MAQFGETLEKAGKKNLDGYMHFLKSAINVFIGVVLVYSLIQQFETTKDIGKALLQSLIM